MLNPTRIIKTGGLVLFSTLLFLVLMFVTYINHKVKRLEYKERMRIEFERYEDSSPRLAHREDDERANKEFLQKNREANLGFILSELDKHR
jgi:hypothetical protein